MDERLMKFRVGLMVVATIVVAVVLMAIFGGFSGLFVNAYVIHVRFDHAPGVAVGTPVRKSGVRIGEVSDLELTPNDEVLVTLRINGKYTVYSDEVCRLKTSLLGDAWLEFERKPGSTRPRVTEGKTN